MMDKKYSGGWERQLAQTAASFPYPPTPDVGGRVRQRLVRRQPRLGRARRLAWAALVLLVLAGALLAVPAVRAAVRDFFQIGALRILPLEATVTPASTGRDGNRPAVASADASPPTGQGTPTPSLQVPSPAGLTTWEKAQAEAGFPLRYPPELGLPDEVYRQQVWDPGINSPVIILVWHEAGRPELALYQIAVPFYGVKGAGRSIITETAVDEEPAFWIAGPHRLRLETGKVEEWRFVPGSVLIWVDGEITYRLEGADSLQEAVRIAESLRPR